MTSRHKGHASSQADKIKFLREHPELWVVDPRLVVKALKAAGLAAPSTYWRDLHPVYLVEEAKK